MFRPCGRRYTVRKVSGIIWRVFCSVNRYPLFPQTASGHCAKSGYTDSGVATSLRRPFRVTMSSVFKAGAADASCMSAFREQCMATKAKTLQVKDKEKDDKAADAPEKDSPDAPSPLLDLSDAAVKKMIKQAKKRGFVTFDQL